MRVNYRQLAIMVFMSFIALKFLALPSLLYVKADKMSWLVALVLMIIDGIYVFLILDIMKRNQHTNLYEFMKETLGVVLSKLILVLLLIKYLFVIANITKGLEFFVVQNLYNEFDWIAYSLPLVTIVGFMIYKGIRNIARVFEMFFWAIVVGCLYIIIRSMFDVDVTNFLPMFDQGVVPLVEAGYEQLSWFGSSVFMLILFGKVDFRNERKLKIICAILFSIALVMLLYFVFYGLFGVTSPTHSFAISDISQFYSGSSSINELSWLIVSLWVVAQTVQLALYGFCFVQALKYIFNIKSNMVPILILGFLIVFWVWLGKETVIIERIFFTDFASIITIIAQYIIPIFILIADVMNRKKRKRLLTNGVKYEENKNNI